jgi:isochorismate hydrolase
MRGGRRCGCIQLEPEPYLRAAGVVTEVCVDFPALSAIEAGYEVFVVTDASGTFNEVTRHAAWARMATAGAQMMSWFAVACELHPTGATTSRAWARSSPITFRTIGT